MLIKINQINLAEMSVDFANMFIGETKLIFFLNRLSKDVR